MTAIFLVYPSMEECCEKHITTTKELRIFNSGVLYTDLEYLFHYPYRFRVNLNRITSTFRKW